MVFLGGVWVCCRVSRRQLWGKRKQLEPAGWGRLRRQQLASMLPRAATRKEINQTSSLTGGNTRGNGLKVKEGTAAVGGGKLLGGREHRSWRRWLWFSTAEGSKNRLNKSLSGKIYVEAILPWVSWVTFQGIFL